MPALQRGVIAAEWVLAVGLGLALIVLALDLAMAWNAQACSIQPRAPNCYPWGRGWAVEFGWHYLNKRNYLASGIFDLAIVLSALAAACWMRPGRRIVAFAGGIAVLYAGQYLLRHFL